MKNVQVVMKHGRLFFFYFFLSKTCEDSYEDTCCLLCADGYYKRKVETLKGKCYACHDSWQFFLIENILNNLI